MSSNQVKNRKQSKGSTNKSSSKNNTSSSSSSNINDLDLKYEYQSFKHWTWINRLTTLLIVFGMFQLYMSNGDMTVGGDSNSNMILSLRLATQPLEKWSSLVDSFGFTPRDTPCLFQWKFWADPKNVIPRTGLSLSHWNVTAQAVINGKTEQVSAWRLYEMGRLQPDRPHYFIVESVAPNNQTNPKKSSPDQMKDVYYASTFSIGTALTSAPIFKLYTNRYPITRGNKGDVCQYDRKHLLYVSKMSASLFTAISCGVMFNVFNTLIQSQSIVHSTNFLLSLLLSILYGVGTTLASINSQALWQHAPNTLFISLGLYFYIKLQSSHNRSLLNAAFCAFTLSMATICRPTSALYPLAVLVRLLANIAVPGRVGYKVQFQRLFVYGLVGGIMGLFFLYHNQLFFGSPTTTGQTIAAKLLAPAKTGLSEGTWTTPLWTGLSTLLFSPSRGLFVHSPFLIFSFIGLLFSDTATLSLLAPFMSSTVILTYAASTFFDYWGGWCFGPRPLTDLMPTLLAMIAAGAGRMKRWYPLITLLICTGILSVMINIVGMYTYDPMIWNYQKATKTSSSSRDIQLINNYDVIIGKQEDPPGTVMVNIDDPEYRWRLWDFSNGQPLYLLKNFDLARKVKKNTINQWLNGQLN